uniref:hypothetical protein n=1 Tax=Enterobacter sp. TaxID=42895 RepID=UPI00296F52BE
VQNSRPLVIFSAILHQQGAHPGTPPAMFKFLDGSDTAFPSQPRDGKNFPLNNESGLIIA